MFKQSKSEMGHKQTCPSEIARSALPPILLQKSFCRRCKFSEGRWREVFAKNLYRCNFRLLQHYRHEAGQAAALIRVAAEGQRDVDHSLFEVSL
jgi:hypothetical protein